MKNSNQDSGHGLIKIRVNEAQIGFWVFGAIKCLLRPLRQTEEGHVMDGCMRLIYWWRLTIHFCHESITLQGGSFSMQ